jgi:hypothetical protein
LEVIKQYQSPHLEETVNGYATWLTRRLGGQLPAPHIHLIGAPEDLWPLLRESARRTGQTVTRKEWKEGRDASAFLFFRVEDGQMKRVDRNAKRAVLPWLFPFYTPDFAAGMDGYDAIVVVRLRLARDPRRQLLLAGTETAYVVGMWTQTPIDLSEHHVCGLLNDYLREHPPTRAEPT